MIKSLKKRKIIYFDPETKATNFTEEGIAKIERGFDIDNLYDLEHQTLYHYVIQALRARVMFQRDVDYIVKEGKVLLVDAFTGRTMEGRSLSNGLHQAIEAKEGLELTEENKTQASITIQNYFRLYPVIVWNDRNSENRGKGISSKFMLWMLFKFQQTNRFSVTICLTKSLIQLIINIKQLLKR